MRQPLQRPATSTLSGLSVFLLALILLITPLAAASLPFTYILLNPEPWNRSLDQALSTINYAQWIAILRNDLTQPSDADSESSSAQESLLIQVLQAAAPPDYLRGQGSQIISETTAYLNLRSTTLHAAWDLTPVILNLRSERVIAAYEEQILQYPACKLSSLANLPDQATLFGSLSAIECRPEGLAYTLLLRIVQNGANSLAAALPTSLLLLPTRPAPPSLAYRASLWAFRLTPLLLIMIVAFFLWLNRLKRAPTRQLAIVLSAAGCLTILLALLGWWVSLRLLALPALILPDLLKGILTPFSILALPVLRSFYSAWVTGGLLSGLLGAALLGNLGD